MRLGIICVRKQLDKVVRILFVFGDVQLRRRHKSAVETFDFSILLRVVDRRGEFFHLKMEESTK